MACTGTVDRGAPLDTSQAGPATFSVRALDDAGNESLSSVDYFVRAALPFESVLLPGRDSAVMPSPVAQSSRSAPWRPGTREARRLRPAAGAIIGTRRPLLRWKAYPGARLYNVQVFRLRGRTSLTKVVSTLPRLNRFRVPAGRIAWGTRYIWQVWPYLGRGYPSRPLGLSYFSVRRP